MNTPAHANPESPGLCDWPGSDMLESSESDSGETASSGGSGFVWIPTREFSELQAIPPSKQLAESTPVNAELRKWAARPTNTPPPSWWEDTTDPFQPASE